MGLTGNIKRKNKLHSIAVVAGLCIALSPLQLFAAAAEPAQIDIGPQGNMIDTTQLDQFNAAQDARAVKYIELDEQNNLITSDVPIKHVYMASNLKDLGYSIQAEYAGTADFLSKSSRFTLSDARLQQTPVIPEFVMAPNAEYQPAATTYASTAKSQAMSPQAKKLAHDAARSHSSIVPPTVKPQHEMSAKALEIALSVAGVYILFLLALRNNKQKRKMAEYKGELGAANEMVGRGALFNFSSKSASHLTFPSNRSNLHMSWNIKKFIDDKQDGVHTYFYMTFYVPPQSGYARTLQKRKATTKRKDEVHS